WRVAGGAAGQVLGAGPAGLAELVPEGRRSGAVHRLTVDLQPAADRAQRVLARFRDDSVGRRTHVQKVVAAFADDVDQLERDLTWRLPVGVVLAEAPGVIDRRRRFPRLALDVGWDDVVARRSVIAFGAETSVAQRIRLQRPHDIGEALRAVCRHQARRVEPDERNRAVTREQFANLGLGLGVEVLIEILLLVRSEVPRVSGAIWLVPILR